MLRRNKILALYLFAFTASAAAGEPVSFRETIAPVLLANCLGCHDEATSEGGYRLDSFAALQRAGDSAESPVVALHPADSELYRRLTTDDVDMRMPLEGDPLPRGTLELVRRWIEQGAPYDAEDTTAPLAAILPITRHPDPPESYRFTLPITALTFRASAQQLLISGYHEILIWDLKSNTFIKRIPQAGQRIYHLGLGADERRIYVASGTPGRLGELRIMDAGGGGLIGAPLVTSQVVLDMSLAPDESLLAAASADRKVHIIDLRAGRTQQSIGSHSDWVHAVDWSDDGKRLASASRDQTAQVFDVASGKRITTYMGHSQDVVDICFVAGDNTKLVSCDVTGKVHIWSAEEGKKVAEVDTGCRQAFQLQPAEEGFWLASDATHVQQFDWSGEKKLRELGRHQDWVLSLALDEQHQKLATGQLDGRVRVWSLKDGSLLSEFMAAPR